MFIYSLDSIFSGKKKELVEEPQVKANKRLHESLNEVEGESAEPCAKYLKQNTDSVPAVDKSTFSYMGTSLGFLLFVCFCWEG